MVDHGFDPQLGQEEFEDTKGAIRNHISKNRQHNGQKKKYKRTNNDRQNICKSIFNDYEIPKHAWSLDVRVFKIADFCPQV